MKKYVNKQSSFLFSVKTIDKIEVFVYNNIREEVISYDNQTEILENFTGI